MWISKCLSIGTYTAWHYLTYFESRFSLKLMSSQYARKFFFFFDVPDFTVILPQNFILDSERREECVDFTMIYFFFSSFSVDNVFVSKNAPIITYDISKDRKSARDCTLFEAFVEFFIIY